MQPGVSSELFDSLKVYLSNKSRLQPIIGLCSIVECVNADSCSREALYLCEVCMCSLNKADMRNHIMGSLHRYNYIRVWHPHLMSEWKDNYDLSLLARPLMDVAKMIEGQEGPGDIQILEVGGAVYQTLTTHSGGEAIALIRFLRSNWGPGEPAQLEQRTVQVQRRALPDLQRHSEGTLRCSPDTSGSYCNGMDASRWNGFQTWPRPSFQSEDRSGVQPCSAGTKPLIGLSRLAECRGEDGFAYCFLCHCCRIRVNAEDVSGHGTSSSHLVNYLMETRPEQAQVVHVNGDHQLLQSLAKRVEQEEGHGEMTVVNVPQSLCIQLTGKSYHWCVQKLWDGWTPARTENQNVAVRESIVVKTTQQGVLERRDVVLTQGNDGMNAQRKRKKVTNPVFKVSLPLTKGSLLLERTSFSGDPRSSTYSSSAQSQGVGRELDCGYSVCSPPQHQPDSY